MALTFKEAINKQSLEEAAHETRCRRCAHLQSLGFDELVERLQGVIQQLDISKTIRAHGSPEAADDMTARARQILIELLGIHLEDG